MRSKELNLGVMDLLLSQYLSAAASITVHCVTLLDYTLDSLIYVPEMFRAASDTFDVRATVLTGSRS